MDGVGGQLIGLVEAMSFSNFSTKLTKPLSLVDGPPSLEDLIHRFVSSTMLCIQLRPTVVHGELVGNSGLVVLLEQAFLLQTEDSL